MDPTLILIILFKFAPWLLVGLGALLFVRSAFGKALAQRIREGSVTGADLATLAGELQEVRRELGEVQERLDFAERLIAHQREALPPSSLPEHNSPTPPGLASSGRT